MAAGRVVLITIIVVVVAMVTATQVVRSRLDSEARTAADGLGAPPGFRLTSASTTGSTFCFGPCLRRNVRYVVDVPSPEAVARLIDYLKSKAATKSCRFSSTCDKPLTVDDCTALTDGPECLLTVVVNGRTVHLGMSRSGPPTELRVTAGPKKDINLLF